MNSSPASDLHDVPGLLFECRIITYLWSRKRFSPEAIVTQFYILLRLESDSERHTEREEECEKCVYSAHRVILHHACILTSGYNGLYIPHLYVLILAQRPKI